MYELRHALWITSAALQTVGKHQPLTGFIDQDRGGDGRLATISIPTGTYRRHFKRLDWFAILPQPPETAAMPGNLETPEARQAALREVRRMLHRKALLAELAHKQDPHHRDIVERLAERQEATSLHMMLSRLHAADIADILEGLPYDERERVWELVRDDRGGEVLIEANDAVRHWLIEALDEANMARVLSQLDAEDLAWLADDLPRPALEARLAQLSSSERQWVASALGYDEESVGYLMTREVASAPVRLTVGELTQRLRSEGSLPEQTDAIYIVDSRGVLQGRITLDKLLLAAPEAALADAIEREIVSFRPDDKAGEAASAFERYDLVSAPVVNHRRQLIGRLTIDTMVDWIRESSHEDLLGAAGLSEEEDLYAPVRESARNRAWWLVLNLCTAFIASRVIGLFESTIEQLVALATLMPIVASIGGNTGNQTTTLIIRALALQQIRNDNVSFVYRKEIAVSLLNGLGLGLLVALFALLLYGDLNLAMTIALAMVICLFFAAIVGVTVPLALRRFNRDPVLGSSTLVTAFTDALGFFVFLGLATILLV
jgi:magnesium transporter